MEKYLAENYAADPLRFIPHIGRRMSFWLLLLSSPLILLALPAIAVILTRAEQRYGFPWKTVSGASIALLFAALTYALWWLVDGMPNG